MIRTLSNAVWAAHRRNMGLRGWQGVSAGVRGLCAPAAAAPDISLTEACIQRLHELNSEGKDETFLRVKVDGGGCSGFQYTFDMDSKPEEGDRIAERDGVHVLVDEVSYQFLEGATIDFEEELIRSAFVVMENPNAESSCGCGSSFVAKF